MKDPRQFLPPMLAVTASQPFSDPRWRYEVKWDGWRTVVSVTEDLRVWSRRGTDLLSRYPALRGLGRELNPPLVLDGELVAWVDGKPSFHGLSQKNPSLVYIAFDCLYDAHGWHLHEPLQTRVEYLEKWCPEGRQVVRAGGIAGEGEKFFQAVQSRGLEGVVAKRLDSRYYPGKRVEAWQKFLVMQDGWFWAVGSTWKDGRLYLILSETEDPKRYIGQVQSPVPGTVARAHGDGVRTLFREPVAVRVGFRERTPEGRLRHAVFRGYGRKPQSP